MSENVRIITDGTAVGTKVFNVDGTEIPGVKSITTHLSVDNHLEVILTFAAKRVDMEYLKSED